MTAVITLKQKNKITITAWFVVAVSSVTTNLPNFMEVPEWFDETCT